MKQDCPHGTSRALWIERQGICAFRTEILPPMKSDEVLVQARFGAISRGTESLVFNGRVPTSEYQNMTCPHQEGSFAFPIKYGYSIVGDVQDGPKELLGRTVFCLHPHQTHFLAKSADIHVIPNAVPAERAVLAANMETALNIIWDAGILPGDRVAIFGGGVVGMLAAYLATGIIGTETTLLDINPKRKTVATNLGITFAFPDAAPRDCDVVINASASSAALNQALECAGYEGRIVEASWYGDKKVEINLGRQFHSKRLSITSSQVGGISNARRSRWTFAKRLNAAMSLLTDHRFDALFSGETAFDALDRNYAEIIASPSTLCHRIVY
ncbi:zinc-binding alcohol dehydrogenase [Phyllobacterium sp. CCNWLW109]|uniref:zinc-dependent alcohol dehydrogenase n=1 Tax=Phyllobacterium sp. CCNWLW109 TaxID=3127479 RepID=UPI00307840D5